MGVSIGGAIGGYFGNKATNAMIAANNRLSALNAKEGNALRGARNAAAAAQGNLARFVQSVNNNRALKAGGNAIEALTVNASRMADAQLGQSFSQSIRNAEQAGSSAARSAFAGIEGSVVDMVNGSTALRDSIVANSVETRQSQQAYDVSRRAGGIMQQMVSGLDSSVILDSLDYNVDSATYRPELGSIAAIIRGGFPAGLDQALGSASNPGQSGGSSGSGINMNGVSARQTGGTYDLADQFYKNKASFGFKSEAEKPDNPYALWGADTKLGTTASESSDDSSSMYSLWSR